MTTVNVKNRARLKWMLRLGLGLVIIAVLIARGDVTQLRQALSGVPWFVLPMAVMVYWLTQCLSAAKWQLLLRARGAHFTFKQCLSLYLLGMFWNLWMPTTIGGDTVRAVKAAPRCGGLAAAVSSILVERLTGLTALLTIGIIGVALWGTGASTLGPTVLPRILAVLLTVAIGFLFIRALIYHLEKSGPSRFHKPIVKIATLHREIDFYLHRRRWRALALAVILSFAFHILQITLSIGLARAVGLDAPVTLFLWLIPLLALMSMIPIGIGGLGVREAAAVTVLATTAPVATIVAWSLLCQTARQSVERNFDAMTNAAHLAAAFQRE